MGIKVITATTLRRHPQTSVDMAELHKDQVVITKFGKPVAAIIPIEELEKLQTNIEDYHDLLDAKLELAKNQSSVPWDEVKNSLGL